ncbi:MAG: NAD(P)-binding domain-containing protein [Alphaproteobacteria bacterium]|nr:NAD(P)-binding domain-containing protein [Alphaproteobacteria bacterium]
MLGIVGTGRIAAALVTGLCTSERPPAKVLVSPRNAETAAKLAKRHAMVSVAADNQAVVDGSEWVLLAVRPQVAREVVGALRFKPGQKVLSAIAPIADEWIDDAVKPGKLVARLLPLPPVEQRLGPIAFFPGDRDVEALLKPVGTTVPLGSKHELLVIWTLTTLIASYYGFVSHAVDWAARNDADPQAARTYMTSMLHALSTIAAAPAAAPPAELAQHAQTKGGLNEQVARDLAAKGWFDAIGPTLDAVRRRLEGRG